jgi:catechol 2,3-dioxygenase-like lactoylglutathione lyase family enzyme
MITKIHSTTIIVSDQAASLNFYVDTLGWEKRIDAMMGPNHRFLTVAPVGGQTELVLGSAEVHGAAPATGIGCGEPGTGTPSGISLVVEDFDATYRSLVERGVRFTKPPEEMPWGDKATWMLDPDGNSFFLVGR